MSRLDEGSGEGARDVAFSQVGTVSFVGKGNSGKTTLVEKVVSALAGRGHVVATAKHHQHDFDADIPGKDSWRHAAAGATLAMVSSPRKFLAVQRTDHEKRIDELLEEAARAGCDLLITEGFKREDGSKIELVRRANSQATVCDPSELDALVTDVEELAEDARARYGLPVFGLEDIEALVDFIEQRYSR